MSRISRIKLLGRFSSYFFLTLLAGWSAQVQADRIITVGMAAHGGAVILGSRVIPLKEVTFSAQMPGRVVNIAGEEGGEFSTGTELVRINDDKLQAQKSAAEAQLIAAKNALQDAQVQYNRELWNPRIHNPRPMAGLGMPAMFDDFFQGDEGGGGFMPGSGGDDRIERHADLVAMGSRVASARFRVTEAEAGLRGINAKLRDTKAIAPFEGVIMQKMVEIGDTVQPGQPLIVFSYTNFLRIQADVPARLMPGLKMGMVVPARLDVGNMMVNARVAQISPVADKKHHTVSVEFDLPQGVPGGPGMYAEIMIPDVASPRHALPVVPVAAIDQRGSLPSVQILDDEDIPRMRLVRIGAVIDEHSVTILSGLEPGDRILVRGRN